MRDLQSLFSQLVRLEIELWEALDARLRAVIDLPLGSFEAMQAIAQRGTCRVQDVADDMAITVGGTSKLIDRLQGAGRCRRMANPEDRRSSLIELTPQGRKLLARARELVDQELERRVGTVLSAREQQQFMVALTRLRSAGHQLDINR